VLKAALQANSQDATAHYLLGNLYFSRAETDAALAEWDAARNAKIPVLDANMGLALLHIKHDPQKALEAFRSGLTNDFANVAVYLGIDQSLSLLGQPAVERVEALGKYPQLNDAPNPLMFELILNLAEAGDFDRATHLFQNHFFPREEGGTNVRQVWVEVQLQHVLALARQGHCDEAMNAAQHVGSEVPGLAFTKDGLEPIFRMARTNYLLGNASSACGNSGDANTQYQQAAAASGTDQLHWAWLAAQKLPNFNSREWPGRLQSALADAVNRTETSSYSGWWMYSAAELERDLGNTQAAAAKFQKALLLPDRMLSYHLTRLAQSPAR
jgi:tetratricopeptide (TPR) repeat protein